VTSVRFIGNPFTAAPASWDCLGALVGCEINKL